MTNTEATAPLFKLTGVPAETAKSPMCTVTEAWWDAVPGELAPLTVTAYAPGVVELKEQEALAVTLAARLTCADGQVTVNPVAGPTIAVKVTIPAKLLMLVRVAVAEPVPPELKSTGPAAEIWKSPT